MTVNPNLATLMRVIDENQDKMTEGEYLEAMNALAALHRVATSAVAAAPLAVVPVIPAVPVNLFAGVRNLFRGHDDYELWSRVTRVLRHINPAL